MTIDHMTSRQRIDAALNHEPTDRVPIDVGGSRITGIASLAYYRLLEHLGLDEPIRLYDIKQQLALPSLDVVNRLGGDVVLVNRLAPTSGMPFLCIDRWKPSQLTDGTPCMAPEAYDARFKADGTVEVLHGGEVVAYRTPGSLYFDICTTPLKHAQTNADIDAFEFPDPWTDQETTFVEDQVQRFYHGTDKALFGGLSLLNQSFFEIGATLFGYEEFMMNLALKRDLMEYWLDRLLAHDLEILDKYLAITGPYLSVIQLND
ncbi:MAG: hypothetical protein GY809_21450, partial [Planctomycetes bacterium]|nr:hypothetical protein [Planctomycetota bacterium]